MNVIIYVRQSQDRDGDGLAVARQEADCRKLCEQRGWTVVEVIVDNDMSASTGKTRPGFERLLDMAELRLVDGIVCWHADRLTHRMTELERVITVCEKAGVKLVTVSGDLDLSTDAGRLNARILAAVARAEVERKGARQKSANEQRARAGKPSNWSQRAFGYTPDRAELVGQEAAAIRDACRALLAGGSIRGIVRDWASRGVTPPQGAGAWTAQAVRVILTSPRIAGLSTYKGEIVGTGTWPAVVDEQVWRSVRAVLDSPSRRTPRGTQALLSGLAACVCGRPVWAGRSHRGVQVLKCSSYFGGPAVEGRHISRSAEPVNEYVTEIVVARLSRPDAAQLLLAPDAPDAETLRDRLISLSSDLDDLAEMFAGHEINRSQLSTGTAKLRAEIQEVEARLADTSRVDVLGDLVKAEDVRAAWNALDLDRQRAVINVLLSVTLLPVGQGVRTFRAETVEIVWKGAE